jgi:L-ascorbate metabolism protein UlaG (beta-lactamase superfamily)
MKLKWYGHASFRITASDGTTIITDPYTPETAGYKAFTEPCDVVIISSHNDPFHCRADLIPGSPTVVDALKLTDEGGERTVLGIPIRAIKAMEALNHIEHDPDQNGMYRIEVDGISIGHMGDVGNALNAAQIEFFRGVDILLALAGGHPTIELDDLKTVIDEVKPRLVVPMHFRTLRYKPRNTFWVATFLEYFDDEQVDFACDSAFEILRGDLPETMRILVMDNA